MKKCLGIEIDGSRVTIAYMERGILKAYRSERVEADLFTDMQLYAEVIQELLKTHGIRCKNVVFVLPLADVYVRRFQLPLMTKEQLNLNLPYEFQDYVGEEIPQYQFDYAVLKRTDKELDILGAACRKSLCQQLQKLAKMARLKLVGLVPSVIGLQRILEKTGGDEKKDYVVAEFREEMICIQFFRKGVYHTTYTMEVEFGEIEKLERKEREMLETFGADMENTEAVNELLEKRYQSIAVQMMLVLDSYSFNPADDTIDALYCCCDTRHQSLLERISTTLQIPVKSMGELLSRIDKNLELNWIDSPQTVGVLLTWEEAS